MKRFYALTLGIALATISWAGKPYESLRHLKAIPTGEKVTMLDSVISENYRKYYQYNGFGYITSVKVSRKQTGAWVFDPKSSYEQTFEFADNGQCTKRTRYQIDESGKQVGIQEEATVEKKDGLTWEYKYVNIEGKLYLQQALAYDPWDNLCRKETYAYDEKQQKAVVVEYEEMRYRGKMPPAYHPNYRDFERSLRSFYLRASRHSVTEPLFVDLVDQNDILKEDGRVTYRNSILADQYDEQWNLLRYTPDNYTLRTQIERIFTLNAAGNRPEKCVTIYYDQERNVVSQHENHYEWDNLGRLMMEGDENSAYPESIAYTYADNYAPERSLEDALESCYHFAGWYPESEFLYWGNVKTVTYKDERGTERQEFLYKNGIVDKVTWTSERPNLETGTVYVYFNADGHLTETITEKIPFNRDKEYYRNTFSYNKKGIWSGQQAYVGSSINGPWTPAKDDDKKYSTKKLRSIHKKDFKFDDLTEGSHLINTRDGRWAMSGNYYVENGEIQNGYFYMQFLGDATAPEHPEHYYLDPLAPLESRNNEDTGDTSSDFWMYTYNPDTKSWECTNSYVSQSPYYYYEGKDVVGEVYNEKREKTETYRYLFDEENRVTQIMHNDTPTAVFTYLDNTRLLKEKREDGQTYRYFYNTYNYVDPAGMEKVEEQQAEERIYDLQGRRVGQPQRGVYIVNGKKVVR